MIFKMKVMKKSKHSYYKIVITNNQSKIKILQVTKKQICNE
jgi:hypothetical protein